MNAYRLNEYEWWAGETVDEAITQAMHDTGIPREDVIDEMYFTGEPESRDLPMHDEVGRPTGETLGDLLEQTSRPEIVCCTGN